MSDALSRQERIFVAGADTLIGAGIITALRRDGYDVLDGTGELDLRDPASVASFLARHRPRCVVLAAGRHAGITGNQRYPAELIRDNLLLVTHVIHEAWRNGATRLMYLASSCSYPRLAPQPMHPRTLLTGPLEPTNQSYAIAKLAGMQMCAAYRMQYGVQYFAGIPADAFGPGDDFSPEDSHVVAGLMRRMHEAKVTGTASVDIWGSGNQRREFIFVPDLADACVFALQRYTGDGPINLGGGRDTAIAELAGIIRDVVGYTGTLRFDTSKPDGMPLKGLDSSDLRALGWQPTIDFHTALRRTYDWFLSNYMTEAVAPHAGPRPASHAR
jgi:GDP-L-fucose synthase